MARDQQRSFFRLEYPAGARPSFVSGKRSFDVIDISEKGLRFKISQAFPLKE